jgi:hypothetical protein
MGLAGANRGNTHFRGVPELSVFSFGKRNFDGLTKTPKLSAWSLVSSLALFDVGAWA